MDESLFVVLGCFGLITDGFTSCRGVENRILKVDLTLQHYDEIMDYMDNCRLFDRPIFELQSIRHFIFNIRERFDLVSGNKRAWTEKQFELYQKFVIDHRLCGEFVKLDLVAENEETGVPELEEKKFLIENKPFSQDPQLKNIIPIRRR